MKTTENIALNINRFFSDDVPTETMMNVVLTLRELGFRISDNGNEMEYASGSICNNRKFKIHNVRMSVAPDDNEYLTVLFYYEEEEYPSYDVIDHKLTFEGGMFWESFLDKYFSYQLKRMRGE